MCYGTCGGIDMTRQFGAGHAQNRAFVDWLTTLPLPQAVRLLGTHQASLGEREGQFLWVSLAAMVEEEQAREACACGAEPGSPSARLKTLKTLQDLLVRLAPTSTTYPQPPDTSAFAERDFG